MPQTPIDIALRMRDQASQPMQRALRRINKGVERTDRVIGELTAGAAAMAAALGAGGYAVRAAVKFGDEVAKTADKVGLTTDALQELRFAADLSGVSQRTLDMAMQRFSRRLAEAANGTGELLPVLEQYGITARDNDEALRQLADAMVGATTQEERLRIAFKAFDSEGAALVNLFGQGAQAVDAMRQQARDLGVVLDERLLRQTEQINDRFTVFSTVLGARLKTALLEVAPAIGAFADTLTRLVTETNLEAWANRLKTTLRALVNLTLDFAGGLGVLTVWAGYLTEFLDGPTKAMENLERRLDKVRAAIEGMRSDVFGALDKSGGGEATVPEPLVFRNQLRVPAGGGSNRDPMADARALAVAEEEALAQGRWEARARAMAQLYDLEEETAEESRTVWQEWAESITNTWEDVGRTTTAVFDRAIQGFSNAVARAIVYGESFRDLMVNLGKQIASSVIASAVEMTIEWIIQSLIRTKAAAVEFAVRNAMNVSTAATAAGAAAAAGGPYAAAANAAATGAAVQGAGLAAYAEALGAFGALAGAAHGGLTRVPREQTYLLQRGERVLSPDQNRDFTNFLRGGGRPGAGGVVQVNVQLGARTLARALVDLQRAGRWSPA